MPDTGPALIEAIIGSNALMGLDNCPAVPVQMARAVYGSVQNDTGPGESITMGPNIKKQSMQKQIDIAISFSGANSETAVWHFYSPNPVHHFVVIPWYKHDAPHGRVYAVFMAYEKKYTLLEYVKGTGSAPAVGGKGYKAGWTPSELSTMLSDLLMKGAAWQDYFGQVGEDKTVKITYWKYKVTTLGSAIAKVKKYK